MELSSFCETEDTVNSGKSLNDCVLIASLFENWLVWCVLQGNVVSVTESTAGGVLDQKARLITEAYGKKHLDFYYTIDTIKMTVTFDGKNINLAIVCGEFCNK